MIKCFLIKLVAIFRRLFRVLFISAVVVIAAALLINQYVISSTKKFILAPEKAFGLEADCILILGAAVHGDTPSYMLEDRLLQGIELYENHSSDRIIMSGDHGKKYYDEVTVMKQFAIDHGVPSHDIFMDHAGFSTYESMYRARDIFQAKKVVIVTQRYHLYRAIYIARQLGLDAYGVASDPRTYGSSQLRREVREVLARNKDFLTAIFKPLPTYLGDVIPVSGDGDITND